MHTDSHQNTTSQFFQEYQSEPHRQLAMLAQYAIGTEICELFQVDTRDKFPTISRAQEHHLHVYASVRSRARLSAQVDRDTEWSMSQAPEPVLLQNVQCEVMAESKCHFRRFVGRNQ